MKAKKKVIKVKEVEDKKDKSIGIEVDKPYKGTEWQKWVYGGHKNPNY